MRRGVRGRHGRRGRPLQRRLRCCHREVIATAAGCHATSGRGLDHGLDRGRPSRFVCVFRYWGDQFCSLWQSPSKDFCRRLYMRVAHRRFLSSLASPVRDADAALASFPEVRDAAALVAAGKLAAAEPLLRRACDVAVSIDRAGPLAGAARRR